MPQIDAIESTVHDVADQIQRIVEKVRPTLKTFPPGIEVLEGADFALDSLSQVAQQLKTELLRVKGAPNEKKARLEQVLKSAAEVLHTAQGALMTLASVATGVPKIILISARTSLATAEIRAVGRGTPLG